MAKLPDAGGFSHCGRAETSRWSRWALRLSVLALALAATPALADGGRVILKDGFVLEGNIHREKTIITENGTPFKIDKANGFFAVDAGARSTIFSPKQVLKSEDTSGSRPGDSLRFARQLVNIEHFKLPPGVYEKITSWDKNWDRTLTLLANTGQKYKIDQRLTLLTPQYARVEAKRYNWTAYFLTSEMDPEVVKDLLYNHPDLKQTGDDKDAEKRFRVISFLIRAQMFDMAAAELNRLEKDYPAEKERVAVRRKDFQKFVVARFIDLIELASRTGRHNWAQTKLPTVPAESLDGNSQSRTRTLALKYEELNARLGAARTMLLSQLDKLSEGEHRSFFLEAIPELMRELNLESAARLETFTSQAQQAERDRAKHKAEAQTPEQLLALAITSWLLGSNTAEAKIESADRLWKTRRFLLRYLETPEQSARLQMLRSFESQGGTPVDEVAAVIKLLPPPLPYNGLMSPGNPWILGQLPFPETALWNVVATVFLKMPATHFAMRTSLPGNNRIVVNYLVQPPPEYAPGRFYPVLIALHENGLGPTDAIMRWGEYAARHGYLLVAPAWERYAKQPYQFTVEEQAGAIEVLRDVRRHFWVDSDRVCIGGFAEGANMALDVGYSHPDLFAGIVCVGGRPKHFSQRYWRNSQYLPCYFVGGELDGDAMVALRNVLQEMMPRGFPTLLTMYKGRGQEWYPGELNSIFDWLDRKKRVFPYPELGRGGVGGLHGQEFYSMRPTDDRFYWLSGSSLNSRNINDPHQWNPKSGAAFLQGKGSDKNQFNLNVNGFKRLVLWLSPSMIDFEKPMTIYLNGKRVPGIKKAQLSMQTMLEDFYQRGDQSQLYMSKIELAP
jgi:predicted esterase